LYNLRFRLVFNIDFGTLFLFFFSKSGLCRSELRICR